MFAAVESAQVIGGRRAARRPACDLHDAGVARHPHRRGRLGRRNPGSGRGLRGGGSGRGAGRARLSRRRRRRPRGLRYRRRGGRALRRHSGGDRQRRPGARPRRREPRLRRGRGPPRRIVVHRRRRTTIPIRWTVVWGDGSSESRPVRGSGAREAGPSTAASLRRARQLRDRGLRRRRRRRRELRDPQPDPGLPGARPAAREERPPVEARPGQSVVFTLRVENGGTLPAAESS